MAAYNSSFREPQACKIKTKDKIQTNNVIFYF